MAIQPKPFSLDTVLNYRKRLEDLAKNRFFEAKNVQSIIEKKLISEKNMLHHIINECEQRQVEGIEITRLIQYEEKIVTIKSNILAIEKNLEEKIKLVQQAQVKLLEKSQEHQVMKRLKHEQNASWQQHLNKKEAAMLDEVAIMRHGKDPLNGQ